MTNGHTLNNGRLTTLEKRQNHMDEQLGILSQDMASVKYDGEACLVEAQSNDKDAAILTD
jgi:hypothetical protein